MFKHYLIFAKIIKKENIPIRNFRKYFQLWFLGKANV